MDRIIFKNVERSDLIAEVATERMASVLERFPDLDPFDFRLTISMDNSPQQAGPDVFSARFHATAGRYKGVILEASENNLYAALAVLTDGLQERLNRSGDRARVLGRAQKRSLRALEPVEV